MSLGIRSPRRKRIRQSSAQYLEVDCQNVRSTVVSLHRSDGRRLTLQTFFLGATMAHYVWRLSTTSRLDRVLLTHCSGQSGRASVIRVRWQLGGTNYCTTLANRASSAMRSQTANFSGRFLNNGTTDTMISSASMSTTPAGVYTVLCSR